MFSEQRSQEKTTRAMLYQSILADSHLRLTNKCTQVCKKLVFKNRFPPFKVLDHPGVLGTDQILFHEADLFYS